MRIFMKSRFLQFFIEAGINAGAYLLSYSKIAVFFKKSKTSQSEFTKLIGQLFIILVLSICANP